MYACFFLTKPPGSIRCGCFNLAFVGPSLKNIGYALDRQKKTMTTTKILTFVLMMVMLGKWFGSPDCQYSRPLFPEDGSFLPCYLHIQSFVTNFTQRMGSRNYLTCFH